MSQPNLTNTVVTKLQKYDIEEKTAVEILSKFLKDFLPEVSFQVRNEYKYFQELIDIFKEEDLIDIKLHYSCNNISVDTTTYFQDKCSICGNSINVSTSEYKHEVTFLYSLKKKECRNMFEEVSEIADEILLDYYLNQHYYKKNYNELLNHKEFLVPFIGAGLSIPFNLPSWPKMLKFFSSNLDKDTEPFYIKLIDEGSYMEALTILVKRSLMNEKDIQSAIKELFNDRLDLNIKAEDHNYIDLINLYSSFYLTTNYDNIFTALKAKSNFAPPLKWDEIDDIQTFLTDNKGSMIHLHGVVHVPQTMIVTQDNYEKLYSDTRFETLLSSFMSNRTFLFLGFSFSDKFFVDLYEKIYSKIKGTHFIILPNVSFDKAKEFSEKGLKTIGIEVSQDDSGNLDTNDLIQGIKCVLNNLQKGKT